MRKVCILYRNTQRQWYFLYTVTACLALPRKWSVFTSFELDWVEGQLSNRNANSERDVRIREMTGTFGEIFINSPGSHVSWCHLILGEAKRGEDLGAGVNQTEESRIAATTLSR